MTIVDVINACDTIIKGSFAINDSGTTRMKTFIPEDWPANCYEADKLNEDKQSMNMNNADDYFFLNIYYVDKAEINRDQTQFLLTVSDILKTLRKNGNLNGTAQYFNAKIDFLDRKIEDNIEFIAKITLKGKLA